MNQVSLTHSILRPIKSGFLPQRFTVCRTLTSGLFKDGQPPHLYAIGFAGIENGEIVFKESLRCNPENLDFDYPCPYEKNDLLMFPSFEIICRDLIAYLSDAPVVFFSQGFHKTLLLGKINQHRLDAYDFPSKCIQSHIIDWAISVGLCDGSTYPSVKLLMQYFDIEPSCDDDPAICAVSDLARTIIAMQLRA